MNARPRVAFVVQRCGDEIAGGAEALCLASARTMSADWECDILTTCARDARTWANEYPAGTTHRAGVRLLRFAVDAPRDACAFDSASRKLLSGAPTLEAQEAWMRAQGPYASDLFSYLAHSGSEYDCIFFFSYLYATTYFGLPLVAERSVLVPLAHEEWMLDLPLFERTFAQAGACAFVSEEERLLVETRFFSSELSGSLLRMAIAAPPCDGARFRAAHDISEPYALCIGRVEPPKGTDELLTHFSALKAADARPLSLVLAGPVAMDTPVRGDLRVLGRITEQEKWDALAGAEFVIVPSAFESLSIVALEAWAAEKAILANGGSATLVGQCRRSGGGLWYAQEREFVELATTRMYGRADLLGRQGGRYVASEFTQERARASLLEIFSRLRSAA